MNTRLLVRTIDPDLVTALAERAVQHGRNLEEEHLHILPPGMFHASVIEDTKRTGQK